MLRITMSTVFELLLCPLLLAIVCQCTEDPKTPITCDAGTYNVGETASVTCGFHMDMSLDERTIEVYRFPKNATTRTLGTEVLVCEKTGQSQKHDCKPSEGYKFEGAISNRLLLEMPSVSQRFAGMFTCFVIPDKGTDSQVCELTIKAGVPSSKPKDTSSNLCLLLFLLIPVVVVVQVLIVLYCRRASPSCSIHFRTTPNNNVEESVPSEPLLTATTGTGTQAERAGRQDVGTDCPTDIPLAVVPQETPVSTHVLMSGESGLESQPVGAEDKPTKKKHSGKSLFCSRKSKEKKSKEEEQN